MKIFTKKAFRFELEGQSFKTVPFSMVEAPDWIKNTTLFKLAQREGSIEEIATAKQQKKVLSETAQ